LGGEVELAAKVGKDPFGQHLVDVMDSFGVSTKWMLQDENNFTTFAFVSLMENGERDFYFNRGADGQLNRDEVDAIDLEEFSIVHFGSATAFLPGPLQIAYQSLLQNLCNKEFLSVSILITGACFFKTINDLSLIRAGIFWIVATFFKVSDEEAMMLTGRSTLTDAINDFLLRTNPYLQLH
jgi:fructokinase